MAALELKVPPPLIAALVALGLYAGARISPDGLILTIPFFWIGLVLATAMLVGASAVLHFFRAGTTAHPHCPEKTRVLVARGIYRVSRNPMYLALLLILIAWSLHLGWLFSPLGWGLFVVCITRFQIRPEERVLTRLFGDEYRDYCQRVRRWL